MARAFSSLMRAILFHLLHPAAAAGFPDSSAPEIPGQIQGELGPRLKLYALDAEAFWRFRESCGYAEPYTQYMGPRLLNEKLLEHYVSLDLLRPRSGEVLIDVASAVSPFAEYTARRLGCRAYSLDLLYPAGVHGNRIGCGVDRIPLPDATVDLLTLHCSIDHFEAGRDTLFLREAARLLRPGGRLCVLPVYFALEPTNICDPRCFSPAVAFDREARLRKVPGQRNRFGRYYSPASFRRRILEASPALEATLYQIAGDQPKIPDNYLQYALVMVKR